ncbi:MAG: methyltransferase domain-containing protein [Patescibacteria group bacterium]
MISIDKNFDKYQKRSPDYHYRQINRRSLRDYNAFVEARYRKTVELVDTLAKKPDGEVVKILDIGCGDGVLIFLMTKHFGDKVKLYGVDPVPQAINEARQKNLKAQLDVGTAYQLPYPNNCFDMVISTDVIEHLENPQKMLGEVKRVSKSNASIVIGTPIRTTQKPLDPNHFQEFFPEDLLELIRNYFNDVSLHESHNLIPTLLYNAPTKSFLNFKYLINLLSLVFGYNPFQAERSNKAQMFTYMYITCRK